MLESTEPLGVKMMSRNGMRFCLVLIAGSITLCSTSAFAINLHDGEWEVTTTMQGGKPQVNRDCITKKDLAEKEKDEEGCTTEKKISGNTFSMHTTCDRGGGMKEDVQVEETYGGDTVKGTIRMKITNPGGKPMSSTGTITGKRIGACKKTGK